MYKAAATRRRIKTSLVLTIFLLSMRLKKNNKNARISNNVSSSRLQPKVQTFY